MLPPVIMSQLGKGVEVAKQQAMKQLTMTHESKKLAGFTEVRCTETSYCDVNFKVRLSSDTWCSASWY
jgi:hypothetical protein